MTIKPLWRNVFGVGVLVVLAVGTSLATSRLLAWRKQLEADSNGLVVQPTIARIVGDGTKREKREVVFHLLNRGRAPITIQRVHSPCGCVATADVSGLVVPPGGKSHLAFQVELPAYGVKATRLEVFMVDIKEPLALWVEAEGKAPLPVMGRVENASPSFFDLRSPSEEATVVIPTVEKAGSEPWVLGLECDLGPLRCFEEGMDENEPPGTDIVERRYKYLLTWDQLPPGPNFSGKLWVRTRSHDEPRQRIGSVTGNLQTRSPFSPSIVRLDMNGRRRETVLFEEGTGSWAIDAGFVEPEWLDLRWSEDDGDRRLIVEFKEQSLDGETRVDLPFHNDSGDQATLTVIGRAPGVR